MDDEDNTRLEGEELDGCRGIDLQGDGDIDLQEEDHSCIPINDSSLQADESSKCNEMKNAEPKIGMEFDSEKSAKKFYRYYGGRRGFNVRKNHHVKNKKGFVTKITFCCSKEGYKKKDKRRENVSYRQPESRVGCNAHMICRIQKNGKFKIESFVKDHNHELVATPMKHMLRVNRGMSESQKAHADDAEKSGISIKATMELMGRESGGREHLGFISKDYRNYIHKKRKTAMGKGDAGAILQYFQKKHLDDGSFFCAIQLDEDDMITNIFWADARSVSDYALFGDVICFDTTYKTNEYGRPFAPFVGVNHHKQTILFGAALLYDETADSFKWLFETFLAAMSGKHPKTILTDRSAAMANAISEVFPDTQHRLCVWHIYQNAAKNLSHVFHGSKEFAQDFSVCVYDYEDEDEWLLAWNDLLTNYNLEENKWLKDLFAVKEKWAMVYGRHNFTADMKSTQRSESMNSVLKKYLLPSHNLLRFFEHYERVLEDRRYEELIADFKMMQTTPALLADVEMLRHASQVYTPEVFQLFQKEYKHYLDCSIYKVSKVEMISKYKVLHAGKSREHLVTFDASSQTVICSCMKFSFVGILCSHALKVLDKKNVKRIPPEYILNRWSRDAKARKINNYHGVEIPDKPKESMGKRYGHLCRSFREIASLAAEHEKLATFAHEQSVHLLQILEEMKKNLFSENTTSNSQGETEFVESEQIDMMIVPFDDSLQVQPRGIKRKASVGRPRGRFKDPIEQKKKSKAQPKTANASKDQPKSLQKNK